MRTHCERTANALHRHATGAATHSHRAVTHPPYRAWEEVSRALQKHDHNTATSAKTVLEDAQRVTALDRKNKKIEYQNKMFHKSGTTGGYVFNDTEYLRTHAL